MAFDPNDYQDFTPRNPDGSPMAVQLGGAAPPATGVTAPGGTSGDRLNALYKQYLGRDISGDPAQGKIAWDSWSGMSPDQAEAGIKGSTEAQTYAASHTAAPAAVAPVAPAYGAPAPAASAAPARNPQWDQLRNQLLARANASPNVDPNDPTIKAQADTFGADQTRQARNFLSAAAEARGPNSNLDALTAHAGEVAGQNTASFRAQLIGRERDAQRADIQARLSGALGLLSQEDAARLRAKDQALAQQQADSDNAQRAWDDQYKTIFG